MKHLKNAIFSIALTLVLLFFVSVSHATDTQNPNDEIERIEYGNDSKIIYFKNGTRHIEVFLTETFTFTTTITATTDTISTIIQFPNPSISEILYVIYLTVMIVSAIIGIFGVKLYIRRKKNLPYIQKFEMTKKRLG